MGNKKENVDGLQRNLKIKGIVIPIIFAIAVVIICIIISKSHLSIFPSGDHKDSLTTTAVTQTTEFNEDEYKKSTQN